MSIKSQNHIHFYLTVCLNHTEQKIGTIYSLENLESYIYRVREDNETIMKRIEQLLSSKIKFVSLTRVSQRLVNDCRYINRGLHKGMPRDAVVIGVSMT